MHGGLGRNHFAVKLSFLSAQATAGNPEQIKIWTQPHVALEHRRQLRPRGMELAPGSPPRAAECSEPRF